MPHIKCRDCGEIKNENQFYLINKSNRPNSGRDPACKACRSAYWRERNAEKAARRRENAHTVEGQMERLTIVRNGDAFIVKLDGELLCTTRDRAYADSVIDRKARELQAWQWFAEKLQPTMGGSMLKAQATQSALERINA